MKENELPELIGDVREGRLSRRAFVQRMIAAGLTAPMATQILAFGGVAMAQTPTSYKPTKAGGGGPLRLLWWQGPTLLNPHFATGQKDSEGARLFYEPLAVWDADGHLKPILAAEIPSLQNGGLGSDGKSVTWKLKPGVKWHDGKPFTADDVVFNWEYARDPATSATTIGTYRDIVVETADELTVRISFRKPTPFWANAFVGGGIIPKHLFAEYKGSKSREAPNNLKPIGTGPYKFVEFQPGDLLRGEINRDYHMPNRPHFDTIEMKGGGDAVSAARAVIQTGEYDFAWNMLVEDEVLQRLEKGGKGKAVYVLGGNSIESIFINFTDPNTEVDGERSSLKTRHPAFADPAVRRALSMLVDRESIKKVIYGRAGNTTANYLNGPEEFVSKNSKWEFSIDKASAILEEGGWKVGSDGIREKNGKKLKFVFQTSINGPRQKTQAIIKQACQKAGIEMELKSVVASVFFSSDVGNPDTYSKFYADIEELLTVMIQPDPGSYMSRFHSREVPTKQNKWQGMNLPRWISKEYDAIVDAADTEFDPIKRAALYIKCNDLLWQDTVVIPVMQRFGVNACSTTLRPSLSPWAFTTDDLQEWYRDA
ncbi:peptide ABC transporter substrate-binding protein [Bradyrhizobium japonicum]|uniref:Peptide ABC transporter substrate-binding protein n=1 Tax=Bradyrhizobium japonicum TaxID=375 RepID=A0A1Y2JRH7_BRAJP|nr:peptide ABC transporter substrate-binding protein [Bradyrhizobium japonicum]OSJ34128.1 peptide ABC transporter substrate-binding protein [Bradyrhizobium japonicum]